MHYKTLEMSEIWIMWVIRNLKSMKTISIFLTAPFSSDQNVTKRLNLLWLRVKIRNYSRAFIKWYK